VEEGGGMHAGRRSSPEIVEMALTGDRGDGGAPIKFVEGGRSPVLIAA
jgi:hypothetical protein